MGHIDQQLWNTDISRRRQQYGVEYQIRSRNLDKKSISVPPIPDWLGPLIEKIKPYMPVAEQAIINEYLPGQGIAPHIDSLVFGQPVISLSLLSEICFKLERGDKISEIILQPRSLLVLAGEVRYQWKHSIEKKFLDKIDGNLRPRSRRVSITLRNLAK